MGDKVVDWLAATLPDEAVAWAAQYQKALKWVGVVIVLLVAFKAMVIGYYPWEVWWMVLLVLVALALLLAAEVGKRSGAKSIDNYLDSASHSDEQPS